MRIGSPPVGRCRLVQGATKLISAMHRVNFPFGETPRSVSSIEISSARGGHGVSGFW